MKASGEEKSIDFMLADLSLLFTFPSMSLLFSIFLAAMQYHMLLHHICTVHYNGEMDALCKCVIL